MGRLYDEEVLVDSPSLFGRSLTLTQALDGSGNGRDGTVNGSPTTTVASPVTEPSGDTDLALNLDGGNDYIQFAYNPQVNGAARTYEGWAWRDVQSTYHVIYGSTDATHAGGLWLNQFNGDVNFQPDAAGGSITWAGAWPGTAQWVHWALVFDEPGDTVKLYINGALVSSQACALTHHATPGNLALGMWKGVSFPFDGKMAKFAVYESALSAARIAAHAKAPLGDIAGMKGWWRGDVLGALNDGDLIDTLPDSSGNGKPFLQATGSRKPTYKTNLKNSKGGVRLTGDDWMTSALTADQKPVTMIAVMKKTSADGILLSGDTGINAEEWSVAASGKPDLNKNGVANIGTANTDIGTSAFRLIAVTYSSGGAYAFYLDGAADGSGTNNQTFSGAQAFRLGAGFTPHAFLTADVLELLVFDSVLSVADLGTVQAYLDRKYALALGIGDEGTATATGNLTFTAAGTVTDVTPEGSATATANATMTAAGTVTDVTPEGTSALAATASFAAAGLLTRLGSAALSAVASFTSPGLVDITVPDTFIDAAPPSRAWTGRALFEFSASESASFGARLDGGAWEPVTSPFEITGLADGPHTFEVRATDAASNVDASPASHTWTVERVPEILRPLLDDIPPILRSDPTYQRVLYCHAKETERQEACLAEVTAQLIPTTATVLGLPWWEALIRSGGDVGSLTEAQRRDAIFAYLQSLREVLSRYGWQVAVERFLGPGWSYAEHDPSDPGSPPEHTIRVLIPFPPDTVIYQRFEQLFWEFSDAHLDLELTYVEGFGLDQSLLDQEGLG